MAHTASTPIVVQLHPLPTHSLSVLAHLQVRSTPDLLPARVANATSQPPHMLNHPPVLLIGEGAGEELLNTECVRCQLGLDESPNTPVPGTLYVYVIEASTLNISTRTLNFLYGQLQLFNYRKKHKDSGDLRKLAADELASDSELHHIIARDVFQRSSMKLNEYVILFASANLGYRQVQKFKNKHRDPSDHCQTTANRPTAKTQKRCHTDVASQPEPKLEPQQKAVDSAPVIVESPPSQDRVAKAGTASSTTITAPGVQKKDSVDATEHQMPIDFYEQ